MMDLTFDLAYNYLAAKRGSNSPLGFLFVKRGDSMELRLGFARDGVDEVPADVSGIVFCVKGAVGDAQPMALATEWEQDGDFWVANLATATEELTEWLGQERQKSAYGEVSMVISGGVVSSRIFDVRIENDLWKGTEETPLPLAEPEEWLAARAVTLGEQPALTDEQKAQVRRNIGAAVNRHFATEEPVLPDFAPTEGWGALDLMFPGFLIRSEGSYVYDYTTVLPESGLLPVVFIADTEPRIWMENRSGGVVSLAAVAPGGASAWGVVANGEKGFLECYWKEGNATNYELKLMTSRPCVEVSGENVPAEYVGTYTAGEKVEESWFDLVTMTVKTKTCWIFTKDGKRYTQAVPYIKHTGGYWSLHHDDISASYQASVYSELGEIPPSASGPWVSFTGLAGTVVVKDGAGDVADAVAARRVAVEKAERENADALLTAELAGKANAAGPQTHSGTQLFSGQVELTNQTATNATSAMTRQMVDDRVSSLVLDFDHASGPAGATRVLLGGYAVYTYTLPHTRFNTAWIWCQGGGNGGGSGRCGAAGSVRYGGGGGGAGSASEVNLPVSLLPSTTLVVRVGRGGVGGAAQMAPDSNGLDGGAGVESYVLCGGKIIAQVYAQANGGKGGTTTSGAGGGGGIYPYCNIQSNGGGPGGSGNGSSGAVHGAGTCPGGGGGGCDGANAIGRGGYVAMGLSVWGLEASGTQPPAGVDGATGTDAVVDARLPIGCGGSGGNGGYTAQGGAGRRGVRGGGGGGGGAGTNGFGSGAGGDGGHGFVRIILSV